MAREEPIWVNIGKIWGIFTVFSNFGQKMNHLVNFFCVSEISRKFPTNWYVHFLMDLPIWVNFGLIWGIFTVFCNFGQKTDHLVNFFSIFKISGKFPTTSYVQFLIKFDWEKVDFSRGAP